MWVAELKNKLFWTLSFDSFLRLLDYFVPYMSYSLAISGYNLFSYIQPILFGLLLFSTLRDRDLTENRGHNFVLKLIIVIGVLLSLLFLTLFRYLMVLYLFGLIYALTKSLIEDTGIAVFAQDLTWYVFISSLFGLGIQIASSATPFVEILLVFIGIYLLLRKYLISTPIPEPTQLDLESSISITVSRLSKSGLGTGLLLVAFTPVFVFASDSSPYFVMLLVFSNNALGLLAGSIPLAISGFVGVLFVLYMLFYWAKLVHAASHRLLAEEIHNQENETDTDLPLGTLIIPTIGYLLSRMPHNEPVFSLPFENWSLGMILIYIITLLTTFTYSLSILPETRRFSMIQPARFRFPVLHDGGRRLISYIVIGYICFGLYILPPLNWKPLTTLAVCLIGVVPWFMAGNRHPVLKIGYAAICVILIKYLSSSGDINNIQRVYTMLVVSAIVFTHYHLNAITSYLTSPENSVADKFGHSL